MIMMMMIMIIETLIYSINITDDVVWFSVCNRHYVDDDDYIDIDGYNSPTNNNIITISIKNTTTPTTLLTPAITTITTTTTNCNGWYNRVIRVGVGVVLLFI